MLAGLSPGAVATWLAQHPQVRLSEMPDDVVAAWWLSLNPGAAPGALNERQKALIVAMPSLFGNLNGISYAARDRANRLVLQDMIDHGDETK